MRKLIAGVISAAALSGAVWIVAANATPRPHPGGPYQIYIFDSLEGQSIYALSVGQRAAAARVEYCVGRLLDDPQRVVSDLRDRAARESHDDDLSLVWIDGEGSRVNLGPCDATDEETDEESHPHDSLVVVRDASAAQARHLINEIRALPETAREQMIDALGLDRRQRARR